MRGVKSARKERFKIVKISLIEKVTFQQNWKEVQREYLVRKAAMGLFVQVIEENSW